MEDKENNNEFPVIRFTKPTNIHNFNSSLAKSEQFAQWEGWEEIYRKAFPAFDIARYVAKDGWAQRGGVDRVVFLNSGKQIFVDEKVRYKNFNDIALEYISDSRRKTPGWVAKDLLCDYIAYVIVPRKRCYLLPFQQLRAAWEANKARWLVEYPIIFARNEGYSTVSVCVPIKELYLAMWRSSYISEGGEEWQ